MGTTYANITLKGPKAQDILQELGNQGRSAFVSPTEDGLTTIYEMDSDEGDSIILKKYRPNGSCDFCGEVDSNAVQYEGYCICSACRRKIGAL